MISPSGEISFPDLTVAYIGIASGLEVSVPLGFLVLFFAHSSPQHSLRRVEVLQMVSLIGGYKSSFVPADAGQAGIVMDGSLFAEKVSRRSGW